MTARKKIPVAVFATTTGINRERLKKLRTVTVRKKVVIIQARQMAFSLKEILPEIQYTWSNLSHRAYH